MRPKKKHIACLFSDIRGFTEASKDLESFIGDLVLPNVKACTNTIDAHGGIPRKIGDLIFAYFDHENPSLSLVNAMASAMDISRINESQNNGSTGQNIERYILVASGQAFVGNIGGFDSSVEITALGSPVNYLSRIDEITKAPEVAEQLRSGDIIVSNASMLALLSMGIEFEAVRIELDRLGIEVRNFPDEKHIYIVKPSRKNALLLTQHARLADGVSERWRGENDQVA